MNLTLMFRRRGLSGMGEDYDPRDPRNLPPSQVPYYDPRRLILDPNWGNIFSGTPPPVPAATPSGGSGNVQSITGAITAGLTVLNNWLVTRNRTTGQASQYLYNPQTRQYLDTRTGQVINNPNQSAADVDAEPGSLNLFGTKIKYSTLIVLVIGYSLLQHRGFQKR